MKILLIRNADQAGFGGAEELVVNTASNLGARGYEVTLATALPKLRVKATKANIKLIKSPWLRYQSWHGWKQLLFPLYLLWLTRLVLWYIIFTKREHPEILHAQNRDDWIAAGIAGRLTKTRVIWSDHADLKHEVRNIDVWYKNWQGKLVLWASRFAEVITVDSKAELRDINKSLHGRLDGKIKIAYNGVFDIQPKPVTKHHDKFVFGATSRLLRQKGLFELIEAFERVHTKRAETQLWLVGDGWERAELEARANNHPAIKFLGYKTNPLDYAASFDVFVHPSYTEGFSLSIIEAAMLKLPIIATNVGGNPEIIEHENTGLLIPSHNVDALEAAMLRLRGDRPLRQKLAKNARARFEKDFEFGQLVNNIYIPLYNKK